ncbi:SGNH/GDSL hydrolase family protein [Aurantiacibacter gilvus]|uniref:SGNH/GDSL hydrolase family protein n=1 Tax=Aurantiacibacter gilvus TaxID=3139141 RepID=A0ABU9IHX2_9SPHN
MYFINKLVIAAAALLLAAPAAAEDNWVASWTASPHAPLGTEGPFAAASYDDVTISQVVRITEGGSELRVRLTNRYGDRPLVIGGARVYRIYDGGREIRASGRRLTFGGEESVVIPRGAPFVSDVVDLQTEDFDSLVVVLYLPEETGPCTCHLTGLDTLSVSPPGNHVWGQFEPVSTAQHRAFLSAIEVNSDDALGTIVAFGDSITDGVGSTPGENRRWPDVLAERLEEAGMEYAVANAGISGNRVLSPGMGESALARFDEDVLSLPNVTHIIIFEGVNDIGNRYGPQRPGFPGLTLDQPEIDVQQMIDGYRQLIARAHAEGIAVIGAPIGPYKGASYWSEEGEAARQAINDWIVNSGEFDAVTRLDLAFADPEDPTTMREGYHMGDFLHGSDAGLRAVGESIDLSLFAQE